ncbi:hypothetical protein QJS10_CPB11g00363 [Acorus calamus]|uniref:Uncharacterized protein n=1 Tax=Acorus calamus TaxID=4465 RepID=A0AAV9DTH6_ACOCL|nr:hypothetical protein QJS10_CPB11g00363 [Acorus calamus]
MIPLIHHQLQPFYLPLLHPLRSIKDKNPASIRLPKLMISLSATKTNHAFSSSSQHLLLTRSPPPIEFHLRLRPHRPRHARRLRFRLHLVPQRVLLLPRLHLIRPAPLPRPRQKRGRGREIRLHPSIARRRRYGEPLLLLCGPRRDLHRERPSRPHPA